MGYAERRVAPAVEVWRSTGTVGATRVLPDGCVDLPVLTAWARSGEPPPLGARLVALLDAGCSVAAAADRLGWSTRQLQRRTQPVFGYGPQHLGRVLRLGRALREADRGTRWSVVAAGAGYADQAHLSRDVRGLTGLSPSALRQERVRSMQDSSPPGVLASATWTPPR